MVDFRFDDSHQLLSLTDEQTERVLDALSTKSAREVLAALEDGPATVTELATKTNLTEQNISYHLGKLAEADLVTTTGTRGNGRSEAAVYEQSTTFLVSTEREVTRDRLRMGVVGILLGSLFLSSVYILWSNRPLDYLQ